MSECVYEQYDENPPDYRMKFVPVEGKIKVKPKAQ